MKEDMVASLIDCLSELRSAQGQLDYADDQEDEFLVSIHWAINDIIEDIQKKLN